MFLPQFTDDADIIQIYLLIVIWNLNAITYEMLSIWDHHGTEEEVSTM